MATTPNRGYQLPAPGSKLKDDVLRLIAAFGAIDTDVAGLLTALAGKSDLGHGHAMAEITGLIAALGNKLDVGYHDALANLTDVDVAGVANGMALLRQASKWIPVALQINNIAGLETALNGKATPADITAAINALVAAAPGALDTLNELATALGNDPDFATTVSVALGNRVRADAAQAFSVVQKGQARANIGADVLAGFRNKLINPVWLFGQRATSGSIAAGNSGFVGDRWQIYNSTNQTLTWTIITGVSTGGALPRGVRSYLNIGFSVAPTTGAVALYQRIEGADTLEDGLVTSTIYTSFGAAADLYFNISQQFGTGGSPEVSQQGSTKAVALGLFNRQDQLFTLASTDGKTFGTGHNLVWSAVLTPRHAVNYAFSAASLVEGDATADANPLALRHIQQELALCQRYYFKPATRWLIFSANNLAGESAYHTFALPGTMRTTPSITKSGEVTNNASAMAFTAGVNYCEGTIVITANGTGFTYCNVALDAEL